MKDLILEGCGRMGVPISREQADMLCAYARLLSEWNKKMNLTAIRAPEDIAAKHFLDSISVLLTGKIGKRVIDVGTGAGFPGMVIKIMRPETELTLLDSLNKRIEFLRAVSSELGIEGAELVHARAEDAGRMSAYREGFDTAVSRAVANMRTLSEWCLPFVKTGGYFLAMKGPSAAEELEEAKRAVYVLGGSETEILETEIPFADLRHRIIEVKKIRKTPMRFPRKPAAAGTPAESCYRK